MTALDDFRDRVEEVALLLDKVAPGWTPDRPSSSGHTPFNGDLPVGLLSRSALVLLVSYFEGFLKDLNDYVFDELLLKRLPCDRLPLSLRGQAVMSHVRQLRTSSDPLAVWDAVTRIGELGVALNTATPVTESMLAREETRRELTSIDPQRINSLLRALGDPDLKRGPMSRHAQGLSGLKQLRDNAVHGNEQDLPSLGFSNVSETVALLLLCADDMSTRVDQLLKPLIEPLVGDTPAGPVQPSVNLRKQQVSLGAVVSDDVV